MRLLAGLVAAVLVLSSCGGDGMPDSFDASPGEIDVALASALSGVDAASVPIIQRRFLEGCVMGGGDSIPQRSTLEQQGLLAVCGCSYNALVEIYREQARLEADPDTDPDDIERRAVELFRDAEDALRDGGPLAPDVTEVVAGCIESSAF